MLEESRYIGKGKIFGYDLYNLVYFPGIVKGVGEIKGELYEINHKTLKKIDRLEAEGYLYSRVRVSAYINSEIIDAETYIFNGSTVNAQKIESEW